MSSLMVTEEIPHDLLCLAPKTVEGLRLKCYIEICKNLRKSAYTRRPTCTQVEVQALILIMTFQQTSNALSPSIKFTKV